MDFQNVPVAESAMLIRRPVSEVFEAFVNPAITCKFWFTHGSDRLQEGRQVRWHWEMYAHTVQVTVRTIVENRRIVIEWGEPDARTTVEWTFTPRPDDSTFVRITDSGFKGTGDEIVRQALGSTDGFALVLAGAKAALEHGIILNLIADRFPPSP